VRSRDGVGVDRRGCLATAVLLLVAVAVVPAGAAPGASPALVAFDPRTGAVRWQQSDVVSVLGVATRGDRTVAVTAPACGNAQLEGLNSATGAIRWTRSTEPSAAGRRGGSSEVEAATAGIGLGGRGSTVRAFELGKGMLVISASDGALVGLDARTGRQVWRRRPSRSGQALRVIADSDALVLAVEVPAAGAVKLQAGVLRAFDRRSGTPIWNANVPASADLPVVVDATSAYIPTQPAPTPGTAPTLTLHVLDLHDGTERWHAELRDPMGITADRGVVVYADAGGILAADTNTGQQLWRADPINSGGPTAASDIGAAGDGNVYVRRTDWLALDLHTGQRRWALSDAGYSPAVVPSVSAGHGLLIAPDRGLPVLPPPIPTAGSGTNPRPTNAPTPELVALAAADGHVVWHRATPAHLAESTVSDGAVYLYSGSRCG